MQAKTGVNGEEVQVGREIDSEDEPQSQTLKLNSRAQPLIKQRASEAKKQESASSFELKLEPN